MKLGAYNTVINDCHNLLCEKLWVVVTTRIAAAAESMLSSKHQRTLPSFASIQCLPLPD